MGAKATHIPDQTLCLWNQDNTTLKSICNKILLYENYRETNEIHPQSSTQNEGRTFQGIDVQCRCLCTYVYLFVCLCYYHQYTFNVIR